MILTKREHKAIAINCTGRNVLTYDLGLAGDNPYHLYEGGYVSVISRSKNPRYDKMRNGGRLMRYYEKNGDGAFWIMKNAVVLTAEENVDAFIEFAEEQRSPVIEEGDRVAILCYDRAKNYTEVHTVLACNVNSNFSDMAVFEEETEEETMPEILRELRR